MIKEALISVLMYVFENYIDKKAKIDDSNNNISSEMLRAGFTADEIKQALNWYAELGEVLEQYSDGITQLKETSFRVLTDYERHRIDEKAYRFLLYLQEHHLINASMREVILDRVIALDDPILHVADIKWVTLMVLFSLGKTDELIILENMVLGNIDFLKTPENNIENKPLDHQ